MMNEVQIIVRGGFCTGKTTIACEIARMLSIIGLDVGLYDGDTDEAPEIVTSTMAGRMKRLRENLRVVIKTEQVSRRKKSK